MVKSKDGNLCGYNLWFHQGPGTAEGAERVLGCAASHRNGDVVSIAGVVYPMILFGFQASKVMQDFAPIHSMMWDLFDNVTWDVIW